MPKNYTKSEEEKITNSRTLDLPSCPLIPTIFIKSYTRSIIFVTFCQKLSQSWIYLWTNFLEVHWRCLPNIALQNSREKTPYFFQICPWDFSFHTIHLYTLGLLIMRQFIEKAFPELIPKLIWHLNMIPKTHFQYPSKRFAKKYLKKMQNFI